MSLVNAHRDSEARGDGDGSGGPDGGAQSPQVGGYPADDGASGVSAVAPESVNADGASPPQRVGDIAYGGQQGRVDHGRARTEQRRRAEPPLDELADHLSELPADHDIVAYCVLAHEAVRMLTERGRTAMRLADGMLEWRLADLPVATSSN